MKLNLETIGSLIVSFFNNKVQQIARQTKFVQRVSDLTGPIFLQALVFACLEHPKATVNHFAQTCLDLGIEIRPQGVDERINEQSVSFMQVMFTQAMAGHIC